MVAAQQSNLSEFFPTPSDVISRLISPVYARLKTSTVLEPSAGKGDIADYLTDVHGVDKGNLYVIEPNLELQFILAGKGYRVLGSDFLSFNEPYHFDIIIMNPPFSAGVDHILKAWEIVAPGGMVVCLLNTETIDNPFSEKRKLLKRVIDEHGSAEKLGPVFEKSARTTGVNVALVVLNKPEAQRLGFMDGADFDTEADAAETAFTASPLAHRNMIRSLVDQYTATVTLVKQRHDLSTQIAFYLNAVKIERSGVKPPAPLNEELTAIKSQFWAYVFEKTKLGSAATSKFRAEFEKMRASNNHMSFTVDNIMAVLSLLVTNYDTIITRCVVDTFDQITALHEDNKVHTEGWKTNKSWRVARKIIVPYGVLYEPKWDGWSTRSYKQDFFSDLDRACCFLSGVPYDTIAAHWSDNPAIDALNIDAAIYRQTRDNRANWADKFESRFFTIRIYKKGTVHLTFKDEALWAKFNVTAAGGKNWVGAGF